MITVKKEVPKTEYEAGMRYAIVLNTSIKYFTEKALNELYKKIGLVLKSN